MAIGEASVRIVPDTSGFAAQVKKDVDDALNGINKTVEKTTDQIKDDFTDAGKSAEKAAKGIGGEFKKLSEIIGGAALTRSVVMFAKSSIDASSDLNESINAVQVTFGELSDQILEFSKDSARAVGLASSDFNSFAVRFAGFTKVIANGSKDAADVTVELTTRIADFASVMNLDLNEAATVFASTLAGESEAIRRFGIDMSAASIEAYALATGMIKSKDEMTASIKVQATYAKLLEDTRQVAGDFVNTSDSLANRQRILAAEFKNTQAEIGKALVPALEGLLSVINPLVTGLTKLPESLRNLIAVVALSSAGTFGLSKSLVAMAQTAGISEKAISSLKLSMGLLNTALIAFSLYQQQQANNARAQAQIIDMVTTATEEQIDAMQDGIQTFMDLQGLSPEEMFKRIAESSLGAAQRLLDTGQAQELLGITMSQGTLIIGEQIRAQQQANDNLDETAALLAANELAAQSATDQLASYVSGLGFVVSESGNVEASQQNMARAIELAQERYDNAVQALEDYVDALDAVFTATRRSIDTGFAVVDAELEAQKAIDEATKALNNKSLSATELDSVMRNSAKSVLDAADAEVEHARTLAETQGQVLTTAETQQIYLDTLTAFRDTLDPASPLAQYINGFIIKLGEVPTDIPIELTTEVETAQRELSGFEQMANDMGFQIGNQITKGILQALAPLSPEFAKLLREMQFLENQAKRLAELALLTPKNPQTLADLNGLLSFAEGGIFNQPQVGLFAEAGAEAVIPLTNPPRALELMRDSGLLGLAQAATGGSQNFDIKVVSSEPMRTAKDVVREFQALEYRMSPI